MKRFCCIVECAPLGTNYWRKMERREIAGTAYAAECLSREYFESAGFKVRRVEARPSH